MSTEYQVFAETLLSQDDKTNLIRLHEYYDNLRCTKETRPYLTGVGTAEGVAILLRPDCKCWNCPKCAARNARRWIARIINHMNHNKGKNWQLMTLTAHEKMRGEASIKNIRKGWKKLYNRIRDTFGVSDYCKVWEHHSDGTFHLHAIVDVQNKKFTKRWLKNAARACGMGYMADLRKIDNAGIVAGYVAKYFLKSEAVGAMPRGLRRIEVSRNWEKLPDLVAENNFSWIINETRDGQLRTAGHYHARGYEITDYVKDGHENED